MMTMSELEEAKRFIDEQNTTIMSLEALVNELRDKLKEQDQRHFRKYWAMEKLEGFIVKTLKNDFGLDKRDIEIIEDKIGDWWKEYYAKEKEKGE